MASVNANDFPSVERRQLDTAEEGLQEEQEE
jgi:hypothetical protein